MRKTHAKGAMTSRLRVEHQIIFAFDSLISFFVPFKRASHHFTNQFDFNITTMNMLCNKVKDLGNPDSVFNNSDQSSQIQPPVPLASEPVRDPLTES